MTTNSILQHLVFTVFLAASANICFSQTEEEDRVPSEQIPVEDRETGDSFIEDVGELPGDIVTFPVRVVFKGISKTARLLDLRKVHLRVTDWLTNEDGTRKVRPVFAPSGGGGATFVQENFFKDGMTFRAHGSFGHRTRRLVYGRLRDPQLFQPGLGLQFTGFHQRMPDEDFFGLGNQSLESNETNYQHEENSFEFSLISTPFKAAQLSIGFVYSNVNIKEGRDRSHPSTDRFFSTQPVPGLPGAETGSLLFKFYRDSRNATGHPTSGGEELLSFEFAREIKGSSFGYRKYTLDLRRYIDLFYQRVLAVRVRTEVTDKMAGREIPFYRLAGLGGADNLRGYRPVRFRDKDLVLLGAEYRFPIHLYTTVYGFFEEGRVFNNVFDEFAFSDFKYSTGAGLRFRARNGNLTAIFEIAKSREQTKFIFGLNTDLRRF